MRWFRDHIRQGSWLALVAIAINFAVAFGHVHAIDGTRSERGLAALVAAAPSSDRDQTQNHPADRADYLCPICLAAAAIGAALTSTAPALPVEFADVAVDHAIEYLIVVPPASRGAFQSRGPPVS
jgi:hypothetical protein